MLVLIGCNSKNHFYETTYDAIDQKISGELKIESSSVLIIPLNGCTPCVSNTLKFLEQQVVDEMLLKQRPNIFFTRLSDDKKFNFAKAGKILSKYHSKVEFDSLNIFDELLFGDFNVAPVLINYNMLREIENIRMVTSENYNHLLANGEK